jgi:hypothetical protein
MKKLIIIIVFFVTSSLFFFGKQSVVFAVDPTPTPPYEVCRIGGSSGVCPKDRDPTTYPCANTYEDWLQKKDSNYWVYDPEVTSLAKAGERSRQFLYWSLTTQSIENDSSLMTIWSLSRNISLILLTVIGAVIGLGIIIGKRYNFGFKVEVSPVIIKIALSFLYVMFSALIVISIIQLSDGLMKLFAEQLGVSKLFNIFFTNADGKNILRSSEEGYKTITGCRNLNIDQIESVTTSKFLVNLTNMTYYLIGIMLILRKVLLWFMLFVAPFLAILMQFVLIRNIGWIWIGVFFQWVFYGPLLSLFLGAVATIWNSANHIPFQFNFTRVNKPAEIVYPTAISILYGGPAQIGAHKLFFYNTSNYVDTFAEYIIGLIMLWAVVFFPWWLLRIFRDYCCDGIYAMKNILLSMYDQMRSGKPPPPPPGISPTTGQDSTGTALKMPREIEIPVKIRLETIEEIRKTKTEDITRSMNISASKLTDIAQFETNKMTQETVRRNLDYLANPTKAQTPQERQKYMNIRTELFNRAIKEDKTAQQILSSISTSPIERIQKREEIIKTLPQSIPVTHIVSIKVKMPQEKISSINNSVLSSVSSNTTAVNSISQQTNTSVSQVQQVLSSFKQSISQIQSPTQIIESIAHTINAPISQVQQIVTSYKQTPIQNQAQIIENIAHSTNAPISQVQQIVTSYKQNIAQAQNQTKIIENIARDTKIDKEKVTQILKYTFETIKTNKELSKEIALKEHVDPKEIEKVINVQTPLVAEPERNIDQAVSIPPSISLEDYEEVKKMWTNQYEKGEVPITENITSREQWVDQDIIFITNTLNKLTSADPVLQQQGMDDLGYILPIFLVNNLKGEELVVYLKAKVEAAKTVKANFEQAKELKEQLKPKEEFIDVQKTKPQEAAKTMEESVRDSPKSEKPDVIK